MGLTARPETSAVPSACSGLLLVWRDGGKQPSTRSVTFQHSGLSNWFEEPGDVKESLYLSNKLQIKRINPVLLK